MSYSYADENTAVANDMALMLKEAAALWEEIQDDASLQFTVLATFRREGILLRLRKLTQEVMRGAEHLKGRLETDLYTVDRFIRAAKVQKMKVPLAYALGDKKRAIQSDFYTETSFNQ